MNSRLVLRFAICVLVSAGPVCAQYTEGIKVLEARDKAWSPEQEQKGIELDGPYEAQLVAAEPLILDPVEMTWDAQGRCFVADMRDYPLGAPEGQKPLSRIVQLLDPDQNGRYTKSKVFADHVDHVQGLLPYKDGLIATTRTQILFLRDTNGDGVADEIKPLIEGFNPTHSQLQVSAPRWGLDNCVYFNNGINAAEIYPTASPNEKVKVARCNLRWDPATGKIEPTTGFGQFGGGFDDWGRHFFCSNRNPVMFAVMPYEAVIRNPHAGITQGWEDIGPTGADGKVYPLQLSHTTSDAHAGTHTAACGLGVYRGDLMPELRGEIFVCEPTAQAVVRYHVEANGASLKATRVGDHKEFFRSRDEWTRPVNATTGPDGALYICDIYRQYIDHARFFPEQFVKTHDIRAGEHEGRIWRIVPKGSDKGLQPVGNSGFQPEPAASSAGKMPALHTGSKPVPLRKIQPAPQEVEELVAWLGHKNAWQRETAQRLLVQLPSGQWPEFWRAGARHEAEPLFVQHYFAAMLGHYARNGDKAFEGADAFLEKTKTNQADLGNFVMEAGYRAYPDFDPAYVTEALAGKDARAAMLAAVHSELVDPKKRVAVIVKALGRFPDDVWIQRAVLSASANQTGVLLPGLLSIKEFNQTYSPGKSDFIRAIASGSAADANIEDFAALLNVLKQDAGKLTWWKPALLQGLAEGLPKSGKKLGMGTLAEFTAKPPAQFKEAAAEIAALLAQVDTVVVDAAAPAANRLAVIPLLAQRTWDKAEPIVRALLSDGQSPEIATAALGVLRKFSTDKTAPLLYELLPKASPAARHDIVTMLSSGKTLLDFLQRMDRGEVPKSFIGAEQRWGLGRSANKEIKELATKLFGTVSSDRAAVIAKYMDVTKMKGDSKKGHEVFKTICITCHKIRGEGVEIGPDITDVRIKPVEALLTDILDPNRICEPRFMAYQLDTKDGRIVAGIVAAENSDSVTLKLAGGVAETVPRSNIKAMKCLDQSLMPVGVEATITKEQMTDLLAFLRGE